MKEKILFAIKKHFYNVDGTPEKSAQEIDTLTKEHYMRFVEWMFEKEYFYSESSVKYFSTEEVYQYWLTNISKD
jgi:hypothetical protein